jgi:hypothetical protein
MAGDTTREKGAFMKCQEAAESVSRLCDGQAIPRDVAEHIGACDVCRARLNGYLGIGAELRRLASLELKDEVKAQDWERAAQTRPSLWSKGWESMRIPRVVFALLLMAVVALGSSLVVVKARARNQQTVLILTATPQTGEAIRCALSLADLKAAWCESFGFEHSFGFRIISEVGDRVQLGVRVGPGANALKMAGKVGLSLRDQEEKPYWFEPGQELAIAIPDSGSIMLTGKLTDHMPLLGSAPDEPIDPKQGELRFVSPVLLRDKEVVQDLEGASAMVTEANAAIDFYAPREGLYRISRSPLAGSVEGDVGHGRVSFVLNGHSYKFLLAAPVTREKHVWVLRDESYEPPEEVKQYGFLRVAKISYPQGQS